MTTSIGTLTTETFDEQIGSSELPVIVDVWAEWCPPCKALEPVLDAIAAEHSTEIRVCKLDFEEHPRTAARYDVMGLPTLLVFEHGELVKRLVGARGRSRLLEDLAEYLS